MNWLHLYTSVPIASEIYHVRLYTMPDAVTQQSTYKLAPDMLETHWALLQQNAPTPIVFDPDLIPDGGIGGKTVSIDGEMLQGVPTYDNLKLSLVPDPLFQGIVNSTRDLFTELWVEIVVEQAVLDAPPAKPGQMFWPRKRRLFYWGKVSKKDSNGKVDEQDATTNGTNYPRNAIGHVGTFDLNIIHGFKVFASRPARTWLDSFALAHPFATTPFVTIAQIYYSLLQALSPTRLFAIADYRCTSDDGLGEAFDSVSQGNVQFVEVAIDGHSALAEIAVLRRVATGPSSYTDSALFDNSKSPGPLSLYNMKDLGECITRLTAEFNLRFQCEIPTLDEAGLLPDPFVSNLTVMRQKFWLATSRWLFLEPDIAQAALYPDPQAQTIGYTPAANWISSVTCTLPTPSGTGPDSGTMNLGVATELENNVTFKSLFRFRAFTEDSHGTRTYSMNCAELYVGPSDGSAWVAAGQGTIQTESINFTWDNWALLLAWLLIMRWGSGRALVEFDQHGRAIEPFGGSRQLNPVPCKKTFGLGDIGDFPLLRSFSMNPGLLYDPNIIGNFSVYEIAFEPGKDTHIKGIETTTTTLLTGTYGMDGIIPAPPTPPTTDTTPPTVTITTPRPAASVTGIVPVSVTATDDVAVTNVRLFAGTTLVDFLTASTSGSTYNFSWDTTALPNGPATLTAKAIDAAGNVGSATVTVTISH